MCRHRWDVPRAECDCPRCRPTNPIDADIRTIGRDFPSLADNLPGDEAGEMGVVD
jgi:hypothetical protein